MTPARRVVIAGGCVALVAAVALVLFVGGNGRGYVPLYTGLEPADAGEIVEALEEEGVDYRLPSEGTVLVPAAEVHRVRLQLASSGLPRGGVVGFEIMDSPRIGSTDFERRVNYLRALQGELSRTISELTEVERARVHIVVPEESVFVSERRPATAAVLVKLRPMAELDPGQVRGIVHMTAHSVEGLSPDNVTVVDVHGRILSSGAGNGSEPVDAAIAQLDARRDFEKRIEESLTGLLSRVFGPGNVVTRVSAELNFDTRIVDKNLFQPVGSDEGLVRSVQELEEVFHGEGGTAGGVPGVDSNVPGYQALQDTTSSDYERREVTRNIELNELTEHVTIAPGTVDRLSVAVLINRERLTPKERSAVEDVVASAIGLDPERSDQFTVTAVKFDTTMVEEIRTAMEADAAAESAARRRSLYTYAGAAVAAVVLLVVGAGRLRAAGERMRIARQHRAAYEDEQELSQEDRRRRKLRKDIEDLTRERPETVAVLMRTWLAEE